MAPAASPDVVLRLLASTYRTEGHRAAVATASEAPADTAAILSIQWPGSNGSYIGIEDERGAQTHVLCFWCAAVSQASALNMNLAGRVHV